MDSGTADGNPSTILGGKRPSVQPGRREDTLHHFHHCVVSLTSIRPCPKKQMGGGATARPIGFPVFENAN